MKLRKLIPADVPLMLEWLHDPAVNRWFLFEPSEMTAQTAAAFVARAQDMTACAHFAVAEDDDTYLGTVSLKNMDNEAGSAEYAIALRTAAQGRGNGRLATDAVLRYAFCERGLHRVYLNVLPENSRAIALYRRVGFVCEGEHGGKLWFRLLRAEYFGQKPHDVKEVSVRE